MYDILTIDKASELLGITERTLKEKARQGIIPAHKFLGRWYFLASELIACIKEQGHTEPPATSQANSTNRTTPKGTKKTTKPTTPQDPAFNHNETSRINAAQNPDYSQLVADIESPNKYTNQELADRHGVSKSIVGKVKAGLSLIKKHKLK